MPLNRVQVTRIVIALAVAMAVLPVRNAVWHWHSHNVVASIAPTVFMASQDREQPRARLCRWSR